MLYIPLSGVELTEAVSRSLAGFERWIEVILALSQTLLNKWAVKLA